MSIFFSFFGFFVFGSTVDYWLTFTKESLILIKVNEEKENILDLRE